MGKIEDLKLFTVIVETGSISKASDNLNIAKSAVSRRLGLLEERYGTALIDRRPGVWQLTQSGMELHQRALRLVSEMDEIDSDFTETSQSVAGPLNVSLPRDFGLEFLTDHLLKFREQFPSIQLTVDFDDRVVDLARENYDFAIRITPQVLDAATVQKIGEITTHFCASPRLFENRAMPETVDELSDFDLLHYGTAKRATWHYSTGNGRNSSITFQPTMNSNNGSFLRAAAIEGAGITKLPSFLLNQEIESGRLIKLLPKFQLPSLGIFLVHAEGRLLNRRMRLFAKALADLPC